MEKIKKWDKKKPMFTFAKSLEVGETAVFPLSSKSINLRLNLSTVSLAMRRKYTSHINRVDDTIEVTRIS